MVWLLLVDRIKSVSLLGAVLFEQHDPFIRRSNGYARVPSMEDETDQTSLMI